jgi:FkbH-like protein
MVDGLDKPVVAEPTDMLLRYMDAMARARFLPGDHGDGNEPLRIVLGGNANLDFLSPGLRVGLAAEGFASTVTGTAYGNWIAGTFRDSPADAWVVWISAMGASLGGTSRVELDVDAIVAAVGRLVSRGIRVVVIPPEPLIAEEDPFSPFVQWRRDLTTRMTAGLPSEVVVLPVEHLVRRIGIDMWTATRYWEQAKAPCHPDAMTAVGTEVATVLARLVRPRVKAIALDLDDTIWGGLVGEVGPAGLALDPNGSGRAFLEMQRLVLDVGSRGIAVGVVSKNDEAEARRPFAERPEMLLTLDTFVSFSATWAPKAEAISKLAGQLNIGIDAVCLIDDSPMEREAARHQLPGLIVPELPSAPEKRVPYLIRSRLFTTPIVSDEDRVRVAWYKRAAEPTPGDLDAYLAGLRMLLEPIRIDSESFDRSLSLLHKTNQFNLTLWRPSPSELHELVDDRGAYAYAFRLADRLGDAGLISVLLATCDDNVGRVVAWVMSCRVFGRGVEWAAAEHLAAWLTEHGAGRVELPYVHGPRNGLLADVLLQLGLAAEDPLSVDPTRSSGNLAEDHVGERLRPPSHHVRIAW